MSGFENIREHMEVIGADGVHIGTVDRVEDNRIKLIRADSGIGHEEHHHYIPRGLIAEVEGDRVRLTARGDVVLRRVLPARAAVRVVSDRYESLSSILRNHLACLHTSAAVESLLRVRSRRRTI